MFIWILILNWSNCCYIWKKVTSMDKVSILTEGGERVEGVAPVVVSASRATDVPAFYARWFFNRLAKGYCVWRNPFNRQKTYVSFERCRVVVFWTKNPGPILPYLAELDRRGIHYYFQMTLNDYEREGLEPNVPPLEERVAMFRRLAGMVGRERVIWRFDPLMVAPGLTPEVLLERVRRVGEALRGCTEKLVFSFADVGAYRKVQQNLVRETGLFTRENVLAAEMTPEERRETVEGLARLRDGWRREGWPLTLATCGEEADLAEYGIEHNRCVDGELMKRLFADDEELVFYLNTGCWPERDLFGQFVSRKPKDARGMKDRGQRAVCGCMVSKDIGMYDTCRHFCAYCYANTSREAVRRNAAAHSDESESLVD